MSIYIPNAQPLGVSLGHLDYILDTLELSHPSLTHTCLEIAFLRVWEHPSALHQEFELCGTREPSSKRHRLVTLGSCRSLDSLEKRILWSSSKEIVEEPRFRFVRGLVLTSPEWWRETLVESRCGAVPWFKLAQDQEGFDSGTVDSWNTPQRRLGVTGKSSTPWDKFLCQARLLLLLTSILAFTLSNLLY